MKVIEAPNRIINEAYFVFLAGSIEMGAAENWQDRIIAMLRAEDITILNPRRQDWDNSWEQSIDNPQFHQQVEWELAAMDKAHKIAMYFDPATKSPITLLELGLCANSRTLTGHKLTVCCPQGFWRKGNVDIVCEAYKIPQVPTLERLAWVLSPRMTEGINRR